MAALPSPCLEGRGLHSAASTAAPSGQHLPAIFGAHAPPTHKPAGPTPAPFLTPTIRGQFGLVKLFRRRVPRAEPQQPPPSSLRRAARPHRQRASCHVVQGRGARHCGGAGPREERTNDRHPRRPAQWFRSVGTGANSKGPFPGFSNQSDVEVRRAAGKPTPPKGRVVGRPRRSHFH